MAITQRLLQARRAFFSLLLQAAVALLRANIAAPVLASAFVLTQLQSAQASETAQESDVKAAYLYKFASYAEWPGSPAPDPLIIGVAASPAVLLALQEIAATKTAQEQSIQVRAIENAASLQGVHMLFIGAGARQDVGSLLASAHAQAILTVTEMDTRDNQQSIINFVVIDGRVRFAIALTPAQQAGVRLSSRLLAVAHDVIKAAP